MGSRYVEYYKSKGVLTVEIDLEDGSEPITITCSQPCLSILDIFQKDVTLTDTPVSISFQEISLKTKIPKPFLPKFLNFWKQNYILKEENGMFLLATDAYSKKCREKIKFTQNLDDKMCSEDEELDPNQAQNTSVETEDSLVGENYEVEIIGNGGIRDLNEEDMTGAGMAGNDNEDWVKAYDSYFNFVKNAIKSAPKKQMNLEAIHKKLVVFSKLEPDSDEDEDEIIDVSVLGNKKKLKMYLARKVKTEELACVDDEFYSVP